MAFVYTRKEYLLNEKIILKDTKGEEVANFNVTLTDEEFEFVKELLVQAQKDEEPTLEEEDKLKKIVFKNLEAKLSNYEEGQVMDYIVGRVINKLGLDRANTINYATTPLQKKLKK